MPANARFPAFVLLAALGAPPAIAQPGEGPFYRVVRIPEPPIGGAFTSWMSLTTDGEVAGQDARWPYLWNPATGEFLNLSDVADQQGLDGGGIALDMSNSGRLVGISPTQQNTWTSWGWTRDDGIFWIADLPDSPGTDFIAGAINDHGMLAGIRLGSGGGQVSIWDESRGARDIPADSAFSEVADLNNDNWLVLNANYGDGMATGLWTPESGFNPLTGFPYEDSFNYSNAINNSGWIVGGARDYCGYWYDFCTWPFVWTPADGLLILYDVAPRYDDPVYAEAVDVNDAGVVIGNIYRGLPSFQSFVWEAASGVRLVRDRIDPCETRNGPIGVGVLLAINNAGQIVSWRGLYQRALLLSPYIRGDLDGSGQVELADLSALLRGFGSDGGATYAAGDLDCDADVDLQDLAILLANFGE
ncbi:MAG: hypothetical protein HZB38_14495 [Planctomycetes bacterium]|nr:hypothetical protein [Planctomycetota bacterium]